MSADSSTTPKGACVTHMALSRLSLLSRDRTITPCVSVLLSTYVYSNLTFSQSGARALALLALLLFTVPSELTRRTLLALPALGVRTHQLAAEPSLRNSHCPMGFVYRCLSDFIQLFSLSSAFNTRPVQYSILPDSIAKRPKRPFFTPIKEWFFGEAAPDFVENALSKDSVIRSGMFDPDLVSQYRRQIRLVPDSSLLRHQLEWTLILILGAQILHRQFVERPVSDISW